MSNPQDPKAQDVTAKVTERSYPGVEALPNNKVIQLNQFRQQTHPFCAHHLIRSFLRPMVNMEGGE